jgi:hypothetical protein
MSLEEDLRLLVEKHCSEGEHAEVDILRAVAEQGKLMLATHKLRSLLLISSPLLAPPDDSPLTTNTPQPHFNPFLQRADSARLVGHRFL